MQYDKQGKPLSINDPIYADPLDWTQGGVGKYLGPVSRGDTFLIYENAVYCLVYAKDARCCLIELEGMELPHCCDKIIKLIGDDPEVEKDTEKEKPVVV